ncbi:DNA polymerase III subunit delta [Methylosinus sp. Sm6]|uniref:DNA polymerase III subunit delta n=1 Tax=Methylosinus sp. Sm6 TaxID=2866948 RepID=UPI001C9930BB|nr:DNA polymerase III subunit delta [Methylosinus sp. Sm6]MBY6243202.1 DNA polymerase III subunit delta [Methylosinus sp. Sm6]
MVAVKSREAQRFVEAPPAAMFLFLLHGADAGLVRERALALIEKRVDDRRDPFQCVEMSGDAIAADPLSLLDEANTVPLFGGRRAILVEAGGKSIVGPLEQLLAAPPKDCAIVVTAGALKRDTPLRKLIEPAKLGAAIECQPDAEQELESLIDDSLRAAGLSVAPEARMLLRAALGEDRRMSRAELAKLALYKHGESKVEARDVEDIVAHASTIASDRLVIDAFSGEAAAAGEELDRALAGGADPGQLLGGALRYAMALHRARLAADRENGRVDAGMMILMRGGFGVFPRPALERHLKSWTAAKIASVIGPLRDAQRRARIDASVAEIEAGRALLAIATRAGRR